MTERNSYYASEKDLDSILPHRTRKREIRAGRFPPPRQLAERRVGTPWNEVDEWIALRPVSSNKSPNPKA